MGTITCLATIGIWYSGTAPDSLAKEDLRQIAQICLKDGGRAVLGARGLCELWLKEYYDDTNCQNNVQYYSEGEANLPSGKWASDLQILPNPAGDLLHILLPARAETAVMDLEIYDLNGRKWYAARINGENAQLEISVDNWPAGLYLLKLSGENIAVERKFVVQH